MIAQILGLCQAPNFSRSIPERQVTVLVVEPMDLLVALAMHRYEISKVLVLETFVRPMM
jgi:hypothetical protein